MSERARGEREEERQRREERPTVPRTSENPHLSLVSIYPRAMMGGERSHERKIPPTHTLSLSHALTLLTLSLFSPSHPLTLSLSHSLQFPKHQKEGVGSRSSLRRTKSSLLPAFGDFLYTGLISPIAIDNYPSHPIPSTHQNYTSFYPIFHPPPGLVRSTVLYSVHSIVFPSPSVLMLTRYSCMLALHRPSVPGQRHQSIRRGTLPPSQVLQSYLVAVASDLVFSWASTPRP